MALYDPIRDGFRELNRMMIDAKQWDERTAAAEADKEFKFSVLESNLVQQEFQNEMSKERLLLAQHGDVRAEKQLVALVANQAANLKIANEQLGISKDTEKRLGRTSKANQSRFAEELKMKQENHAASIEGVRAQTRKLTYDYTPQDATFAGLITPWNAENPEYMAELNKITGSMGAYVESDLVPMSQILDADGIPTGESEVLQLTPEQMAMAAPIVHGLNAKFTDPNAVAERNLTELSVARSENKKLFDSPNKRASGFAKREVNRIEGEMREVEKTFLATNTADAEARRAKEMMALAAWQIKAGQGVEAAATIAMAKKSYDASVAANATAKGETFQTWSRDLKDGMSVPTGKFVFNPLTKEYARMDREGNPIRTFDLAELNLTTDEPQLPKATGGKATSIDDITKKDMLNFNDEFETEGMGAMFASHEGKPVDQTLQHLATNFREMGGTNAQARQKAIAYYRIAEGDYWEGDTQRKTLTVESTAKELNDKAIPFMEAHLQEQIKAKVSGARVSYIKRALNRARNASNLKEGQAALKDFQNMVFKAKYRKMAGDQWLDGYTPNATTKAMWEGKTN